MKKNLIFIAMLLCLLLPTAACSPVETGLSYTSHIKTYHDIPGVTQEEILAIETLKETRDSFSYGQILETESFILPDGTYAGFTTKFTERLTELFGIEFKQEFHEEWGSIKYSLDDLSLDFTSDFTPTPERMLRYYMTHPLTERPLRIFTFGNPDKYIKEMDVNGLTIGFWRGSVTADSILNRYPMLDFATVEIDSYDSAAEKLRLGEIDLFVVDGVVEPAFEKYDYIESKEFFSLIYTPISLTTANAELAPIITVVDKYLAAGGQDQVFDLYQQGQKKYRKYKLGRSFSEEEAAYLADMKSRGAVIHIAFQHDNYPVSFYNQVDREFQGMALDILRNISDLTDIQFETTSTKDITWVEIIGMLKSGEISMASHLLFFQERVEDFIWSNPYDSAYCAFISRSDFPFQEIYQVPSRTVGILKGSAYEAMYADWFPYSDKKKIYDTQNAGMDALESGEIDLYLAYEYTLLSQLNYREKSGFKVNIRMDTALDTMFGFNKNEELLRSVINKTLAFINTQSIAEDWKSRTFDYSYEIAHTRSIYFIILSSVLVCVLAVVILLLFRNKQLSKGLELTVKERTKELEEQADILSDAMEELSTYNDMLIILQGGSDVTETLDAAAAKLRELCWFDRLIILQKMDGVKLSYRMVASCPKSDGQMPSYDEDVIAQVQPSECRRFSGTEFAGCAPSTNTVYVFGLNEWNGIIILEFADEDMVLNEREYNLIMRSAALFESLIDKKVSQAAMERSLNSVDAMIYVSELETGRILFVNKNMEENYGVHNAKGKICWQIFQSGMTGICDFCPVHKLIDEYSPPIVWEEHSTVTGQYYQNTDRLIRWVDNRLVHIQHSVEITALKEVENNLQNTMGELAAFNGMLMILQSKLNTIEAINTAAEKLKDICGCGRVTVMQRSGSGEGSYRQIASCPISGGISWEQNGKIFDLIRQSTFVCLKKSEIATAVPGMETVYVLGLSGESGFLVLEFAEKDRTIAEKERKLLLNCATLFESLLVRKSSEDERADFAEQLEQKVAERTEELRLMTQEAEAMEAAAYEASRAKSLFLANMSHEIRTPMNAIIGISELLLSEKLDSRKMKYVTEIHTSAKSLLGIINDILDLSKIDEGKLQIVPIDSDITLLLKNVTSLMSFSVRAKGLDFIEDIQILPWEYVRIDETRVNQVLLNLLSNAVKFTNTGYVKFEAKIEEGDIIFKVSDTGIGIKKDDQPMIFAAFEQADMRKNRTIKGTGLGLSISKSLIELMGGKIWLESEYGTGTTFYVTIPYVQGQKPSEPQQRMDTGLIMAPKAHVLLVDDIQANLTVGAGLMRLYGITADMAISGRKAMELVKMNHYDIVFMDHMMPEEDGVEVTKKIRDLGGKYEQLPIVALTANALNETRELLLRSGMDDFLAKPIDRNDLVTILKRWLPPEKIESTSKAEADLQAATYSAALQKIARLDGMDIDSALKRLGGMQDVLEQTAGQMAYTLGGRLQKMDECLTCSDLQRFSIEAHGFKSSLANIGAMEYSILAAELETAADNGDYTQCAEKFALFASVLEGFAADLKKIFPALEIQAKGEPGDRALLVLKLEEIINCLESFETDEALAGVEELLRFAYGEETDKSLAKAKSVIEVYEHDEAIRILRQIRTNNY